MKVKVINQIRIKGELKNLFNYQYVDENEKPVSAVFQATAQRLKNMDNVNTGLNYFVDCL
jgi:hypothetical protein